MKYEKLPTEDFDDDAQELSVELATNVDSDEERDLDFDEGGSSSNSSSGSPRIDDDISSTNNKKDKQNQLRSSSSGNRNNKKRSKWTRHLYALVFLLFTTIVVFTFLPTAVRKLIVWRHGKLYGGSCHNKTTVDETSWKKQDKNTIDLATTPSFAYNPYIKLANLHQDYIPTREGTPKKHLIFIGDVHGMLDEFQELMKLLGREGFLEHSHVVLAGDFISKGPDSVGVLDMAMKLKVSCVRGNHEDEVMRVYWKLQKSLEEAKDDKEEILGERSVEDSDKENDNDDDKDDDEEHEHADKQKKKHKNKDKKKKKHHKNKKNKHHRQKYKHSDILLAKALTPSHAAFIDACPLILKLDSVPHLGDVAVVHAGMIPGVELKHQRPGVLMNIRSFIKDMPTPGRKGVHWTKLWNQYMKSRSEGEKLTVVYGHDARRGLDLKRYTKGLDTNCVRGGRLTALVVSGGKHGRTQVVSVKCREFL
ncbi:hypothetical protein ABW20_dc0103706 [Dactylellina cionopaga]|nr:hypothetical protein ABW20_dc0103706 [Dactylellina cionopaga]